MSWFHKHDLQLVGKTYVPPISFKNIEGEPFSIREMISGSATYIWKCSDTTCSKIVSVVALGKETE